MFFEASDLKKEIIMSKNKSDIVLDLLKSGGFNLSAFRQQVGEFTGNELVSLRGWEVTNNGGKLSAFCVVAPKDPGNAISVILIATGSPDESKIYSVGHTASLQVNVAPGVTLACGTFTTLFDPEVQGNTVKCTIYGLIIAPDRNVSAFKFVKDFTV